MSISVLATKCRFCGETVSRPRVEDRHLTIEDLGGDESPMHRISRTVMNALEAFRAEEFPDQHGLSDPVLDDTTPKPLGNPGEPSRRRDVEIPDFHDGDAAEQAKINFRSRAGKLAASESRASSKPSTARGQQHSWGTVAVVVAALAAFGAGSVFIVGQVRSYMVAIVAVTVKPYENRAREMLDSGDVLGAFREAVTALQHADSDANRKTADVVRQRVVDMAREMMNKDPYRLDNLIAARNLADQALNIDRVSEAIKNLKAEVEEEIFAYNKMTIGILDPAQDAVTLKLIYPDNPSIVEEVRLRAGETARGRFVVKNVGPNYVRFEDTKRTDHKGQNRVFKLYQDGTVD
ncbi:MAG: C2H2-type protein [Candidatus Hydrogenedentes bacterium]|nr:C2H2-type protein [Candidatus Hydrogenedentota bacterium]